MTELQEEPRAHRAAAGACLLGTVLALHAVAADGPAPLPNPLTLEQALAFAEAAHPDLELARARLDQARAGQIEAAARLGARLYLELAPEAVQPAVGSNGWVNDSRARLVLSKPLTDFGRTRALEAAAAAERTARELALLDARQTRRLEIMARFFDVLLADLRYNVDNEEMAFRYVRYDALRERHALGRVSDVALMEAEHAYREALIRRTESEKRQTAARARLAAALNRPGELPRELVRPDLAAYEREIPEYQELFEQALRANPWLAQLRQETEAARAVLVAERARRRPTLDVELEAAEYERRLASRNDLRAGLSLRVPLYQGGADAAAIARAQSLIEERAARLAKAEYDLRNTVLDLVQELETIKVRREAARQRVAFRDLALDRARALYEMEARTDLGDALVRLTEAQYLAAQADFEWALAWARIDALMGSLVPSYPAEGQTP